MGNRTKAQLEAELKALRSVRKSEGWVSIGNNLIRWGGLVAIARYIYFAIEALAGQRTDASFIFNMLGNIEISVALSWLAAFGGILYGIWQRHLRRNTVERLQIRNQELETIVDQRRSSSKLTERGETRPEDRI